MDHATERADLAAALRWVARLGMNEGIANHFSLAVNKVGGPQSVNELVGDNLFIPTSDNKLNLCFSILFLIKKWN